MEELKRQEKSKRDKYDKHETEERKFDATQLSELTVRNNSIINKLNTHLNPFHIKLNIEGGYSIVSVTPVLGTTVEKVDEDEPVVPMVTTTGFLVVLHKQDELGLGQIL